MVALIDLDSQVYAAAFVGENKERTVYTWYGSRVGALVKGERVLSFCKKHGLDQDEIQVQTRTKLEPLANVLHTAKTMLRKIVEGCGDPKYEAYLTKGECFRKDIYSDYKHSRGKLEKPHYYDDVRNYYISNFKAEVVEGVEADDKVAMRARELFLEGKNFVVASIDKDLNQIAGNHYNPANPEKGVYEIDPWEASLEFYIQLLTGDRTDDIPGIDNIGPIKAGKLLSQCDDERDMYILCCTVYASVYGYKDWQDVMHRNAHLLYLLRHVNDAWKPPIEV